MPIRGWLVEREKAAVMEEIEPASTLPKLLANLVATRGKHDAIATVGETLSYEELERRASRMADRKSTRLNSSHYSRSRMPSSA